MSKWQEILDKAKEEQAELRPKVHAMEAQLNRLALVIFEAEAALKKEEKKRSEGFKYWAKVGCVRRPDNPSINLEEK